jgi:hypothetical protein
MALLDSDRVLENLEREFAEDGQRRRRPPLSPVVVLLATAMAGSALLHAANAPHFFDVYWAYGAFFAAVAWFQVAGAAAVLLRPSRAVLVAVAALNAVVALVWIASRTVGVAIGPLSGSTLPVGTADALATGLELAVVVGAIACIAAPALTDKRPSGVVPATLIAFLVVALAGGTAYAMTVSSTTGTRTIVKVVAAKSSTNANGSGLSTAVGQPHNADEVATANIPDIPLTRDQQTQLAFQLVVARAAALQYPTVADAKKAGMILAGGFAPGSGAHYLAIRNSFADINADGTVNAAHPSSYIYDGTNPDSRIIGLMYTAVDTPTPPQGFAGLNDHWHRHANVCVQYGGAQGLSIPFPADRDVTEAQCAAVNGRFMKQTVWMVHAWVVPGWESPQGVFSHDNPDVKCADGTTHTDKVGFCQGSA